MDVWEDMNGEINWYALDFLVELHGVDNLRRLFTHLKAIRDHVARQANA